jgi:hypothetical protein
MGARARTARRHRRNGVQQDMAYDPLEIEVVNLAVG